MTQPTSGLLFYQTLHLSSGRFQRKFLKSVHGGDLLTIAAGMPMLVWIGTSIHNSFLTASCIAAALTVRFFYCEKTCPTLPLPPQLRIREQLTSLACYTTDRVALFAYVTLLYGIGRA